MILERTVTSTHGGTETSVQEELRRACRAFLGQPAFLHRLDLAVLTKLAGDDRTPARERRRAAEALGKLYLQALELLATTERARPAQSAVPWGGRAHARHPRA